MKISWKIEVFARSLSQMAIKKTPEILVFCSKNVVFCISFSRSTSVFGRKKVGQKMKKSSKPAILLANGVAKTLQIFTFRYKPYFCMFFSILRVSLAEQIPRLAIKFPSLRSFLIANTNTLLHQADEQTIAPDGTRLMPALRSFLIAKHSRFGPNASSSWSSVDAAFAIISDRKTSFVLESWRLILL